MNFRHKRLIRTAAILAIIIVVIVFGWIAVKPTPDLVQGEFESTEIRVAGKIPLKVSPGAR